MTKAEYNEQFNKYWKPYLKLTLDGLNWFQKFLFIRKVKRDFYKHLLENGEA